MKKVADPRLQQQEVNAYFQLQSSYWKSIYASNGVYAEIHRERHRIVIDWIDCLALPRNSRILEIGCGAGFLAIALAQLGLRVHAIDSTRAMIEQARQHAIDSGVSDLLTLDVGDVYSLPFEDDSFDLVVAVGVIPWLKQPKLAMQEMARVVMPGGYVIFTADNRARLNSLLDPWLNPVLTPLKKGVKDILYRVGLRRRSLNDVGATFHSRHFIDKALASVGLVKIRSMTLGFGPFSLFRRTIIPEPLGTRLHHRLQRLADRNVPAFRSTGAHYIVLTKKSLPQSLVQSTSAAQSVSVAEKVL